MRQFVKVQFNCLERVHFVSLDPDFLPLTPTESPLFAGVTAAWTELKTWASNQEGGKRGFREGCFERGAAARALRKSMLKIAEMARSIEISGADPGIAERFRMPAQRTYAALVASANAFAEAAEESEALFTARGLPATFITDLTALIGVFGSGSNVRGNGLTRWTSGTAGLALVAKRGMDFVRQLRPIVRARLQDTPALAFAWDLACRVEAAPSSASTAPDTGSGGTTPPPEGSGS